MINVHPQCQVKAPWHVSLAAIFGIGIENPLSRLFNLVKTK